MPAPKQKYFGNLSLDGIKKAVTEVPAKVDEYKGEKQLKVNAAMWDDGNISLSLWDAENKRDIKLGYLRVSTLDSSPAAAPAANNVNENDLPF